MEESWRIFRTAAIMLNLASSAVLDSYASELKQRVADCRHIAAQADIRWRSEWWTAELRRQEAFHQAHPGWSNFSPLQPWKRVIKRQQAMQSSGIVSLINKPALLYKMNGPKPPMRAVPDPPAPVGFRPGGSSNERRGYDPKRRDGRFFKSVGGINMCPRGMAHICEPHRNSRIGCGQAR